MSALIIANGTQPPLMILKPLAQAASLVVCADGGANHALRMSIKPNVIIGDMDSILPSTAHYFSNVTIIREPDQESTDLEKAIAYCIRHHVPAVDLAGAAGDRMDHIAGGLGCFRKFGNEIDLRLIDGAGIVSQIHSHVELTMRETEKLSLIPLDRCTGITTQGLKYPLTDDALELGVREGISNEAVSSHVSITVGSGTLLLYRFHAR